MIRRFFLLCLLLAAGLAGWMAWYALTPLPLPATPTVFILKTGGSLKSVSARLEKDHILPDALPFNLLVRLFGRAGEIRSGNFLLTGPVTPYTLMRMISRNDPLLSEVRVIDGWNFRQVRHALSDAPHLQQATASWSDAQVAQALGAQVPAVDGLLAPDAYYYGDDTSDLDILKRAHQELMDYLNQAWQTRDPGLPLHTPYQALILASIIEKETAKADERPHIAGVFINRLRLNMRLQTDPTVIYGMGTAYTGSIHKRDLQTDTPYNTYTRYGLPPTPIAMPSFEAINAALHPMQTRDLYFVAKGDGSHYFSSTLAEHNLAVARYQKVRAGGSRGPEAR
jgi:UPF0755 protein